MRNELHVLLLEDESEDARAIITHLRRAGYEPVCTVVKGEAEYVAALDGVVAGNVQGAPDATFDIILSDYSVEGFHAPRALSYLQQCGLDIPFIVVTGSISEEVAVLCIKQGAADYLLKDRLGRLGEAVKRALAEKGMREAKRAAEAALRESEERYALAARGSNDGLWDWNLMTNEVFFSERWKSMLGYESFEIGDFPDEWFSRIHPDDLNSFNTEIAERQKSSSPHFEVEHRVRHADGGFRWVLCRGVVLWDEAGAPYRMAGSQTDITERKRVEEQLLHNSLHDRLTGLPNRALLMNRLAQSLDYAKRHKDYHFSLLFLDLDRFKNINDSLGHLVGDELLIEIARRLRRCIRTTDTVARLGGDEFVVLLDDIKETGVAGQMAERIQEELCLPFELSGHELYVSASIGIVMGDAAYAEPADLLRDADTAMYKAKRGGKARHEFFQKAMHVEAITVLQLESDLRHSLDRDEYTLHYQPIVSLGTERITGFEALLRWQHPRRGLVMPGDFLGAAEETGVIIPIEGWVLREACRQAREWQETFSDHQSLSISVNLSPSQFARPDFVQQIKESLNESNLAASSLYLEITENMVVEDAVVTSATLLQLRKLGVHVCLDDFGTGYSSLSYLLKLPVDALKIDRSFVNKLKADGTNSYLIQAIITLARQLGLDVIAEGIEAPDHPRQLQAMDCHFGQGFLFSKPVDKLAAGALLAAAQTYGARAALSA